MMRVAVRVMPRPEVLDSQGRAVTESLKRRGRPLLDCRVGKLIELEIDTNDKKMALAEAEAMAQDVLHNPLIETFTLELSES